MTTVVMMVLMMLFVLVVATLLIGEEGVREGGGAAPLACSYFAKRNMVRWGTRSLVPCPVVLFPASYITFHVSDS